MCPACLAAAAWAVAGTSSAGGLTFLVVRKHRARKRRTQMPVQPAPPVQREAERRDA